MVIDRLKLPTSCTDDGSTKWNKWKINKSVYFGQLVHSQEYSPLFYFSIHLAKSMHLKKQYQSSGHVFSNVKLIRIYSCQKKNNSAMLLEIILEKSNLQCGPHHQQLKKQRDNGIFTTWCRWEEKEEFGSMCLRGVH